MSVKNPILIWEGSPHELVADQWNKDMVRVSPKTMDGAKALMAGHASCCRVNVILQRPELMWVEAVERKGDSLAMFSALLSYA